MLPLKDPQTGKKIDLVVYSDYICPWCYVGQGVIGELKETYDVHVRWKPFFLRPDMPPEGMMLPPEIKARIAQNNPLPARAAAAGLPFLQNEYLPHTQKAHEATEYALDKGLGEEFHAEVFRLYFGEGKDISQWDVLQDAARTVGLDAEEMKKETDAGKFRQRFEESVNEAHSIGVTGVPTYVLNNEFGIVGAQGFEAFRRAIEKLS